MRILKSFDRKFDYCCHIFRNFGLSKFSVNIQETFLLSA